MPIEIELTQAQFNGDDVTTLFPFSFPFLQSTDIVVTITDIDGVDTLQILGGDYSISGAGSNEGSITMIVPPAIGERLTIQRDVPATQLLDLEFKGKLNSNAITAALDKLTMIVQQLSTLLFGGRVLRFPDTDPTTVDGLLPPQAQRLAKFLRFDDINGNPQAVTLGDPDNIGVLLNETDMASQSQTQASSQFAIVIFVEDKILDEDDFASDDPTRAPSQQSAAVFIADQILILKTDLEGQIATLAAATAAAIAVVLDQSSPTGNILFTLSATPPSTWIFANEKTIGSGASGATNRANDDTEDLFILAWDSIAELVVQDSGGTPVARGASAQLDFDADRRIEIADARGRILYGKDDMGGTAANQITNSGDNPIEGDLLGASGGREGIVVDSVSQTAAPSTESHSHGLTDLSLDGDSTPLNLARLTAGGGTPQGNYTGLPTEDFGTGSSHAHVLTFEEPGNNLAPGIILNIIIKL